MKRFFFVLLSVVVVLLALTQKLLTDIAHAADAVPDPFVPCLEDSVRNPEFNSQRPYQASPCGDSPKAVYCNNDYRIEEKVSRRYGPGCSETGGTYICPANETIERDYEITLTNAEFPIMGNTQDTSNSDNKSETIDDSQKLNEYLSWYLSGATQKAEYGTDSNDKIINYSGPTKKLLPSVIQEFQRFKTLHAAGVKPPQTLSEEDSTGIHTDLDLQEEGIQVEDTLNHNQIVVCTTKNILGIDNPWLGIEKPTPCYDGNGGKAGGNVYRLMDWWEGKYTGLEDSYNVIKGWDGSVRWSAAVPPFPWQFEKDIYYQKAYREWRGHECVILLGKLICADLKIPGVAELHSNTAADFYQYIPLGNTTDKNAIHQITGVNIDGVGETIVERPVDPATGNSLPDTYLVEQNPVMFYPHTRSTVDMLEALNSTHTPEDEQKGDKKQRQQTSPDVEPASCEVVDVRSNAGDDLTFDQPGVQDRQRVYITGIQMHVTQIECDGRVADWFKKCGGIRHGVNDPTNPNYDPDDPCGQWPQCVGTVRVIIPTSPKIPYAEDVWQDSVAGQNTAFRKIFPKVEEGAPVSCIADIPGTSDVDYIPGEDTNLVSVNTPEGWKSPDEAKLYFPHLGSIYEYFLKGIQTALRPKGYGEEIVSGKMCAEAVSCGGWEEKLGSSGGDCGICNAPIGNLAKKILTAAGTAYNVPAANIWAAMKHEGADGYQGTTYDFSDENVRKWSNSVACGGEPMPGCNESNPSTQPPFGFLSHWFYLGEGDNALWAAVQKIDPSRNTKDKVSRCNFLDAAFAAAKLLNQGASNMTVGASCGSYSGFNTTSPGSCSSAFWTDTKVAQSQTGYAGSCVQGPLYTLEQAVGWYHEASCK